jgi:peptide/nickel transport system permease protein
LLRNPSGLIGLLIIAFYVTVALFAAFGVTPFPPAEQHVRDRLTGPSQTYLMGTDIFGRDLSSRIMEGAKNSLYVASLSVLLASFLGITLGILSGYLGSWPDNLIMRVMDVFFAFPALLLALLVITVLGTGLNNTVLAIGLVYTPIFARVARGPVLAVKEMEFVQAGRSLGAKPLRLIFKHIFPNILAPLMVQVSLALSWSLLTEAGLSFLGLGVQPPAASWGVMLSESRGIAERAFWLMVFPGAAIALGVLGFNLLGDGLRDVFDPKSKR